MQTSDGVSNKRNREGDRDVSETWRISSRQSDAGRGKKDIQEAIIKETLAKKIDKKEPNGIEPKRNEREEISQVIDRSTKKETERK